MSRHTRAVRRLPWLLRHAKSDVLKMDVGGWAAIADVCADLRIGRAALAAIVNEDTKGRYECTGQAIRAVQGHSTSQVDIDFPVAVPPTTLFHGTSQAAIADIQKTGLSNMKRQYVHMSADYDVAVESGSRKGKPMVVAVDTAHAIALGCDFRIADNGVWLAKSVPREALFTCRRTK